MTPLFFSPAAKADVEEILDFIAADNQAAAARYVRELMIRCEILSDQPLSGRARTDLLPGLRSIPFKSHVIFYTATDSSIRIERILHGARDLESAFPPGGG